MCDVCWRLEVVLYALEMLEVMRLVMLFTPVAVERDLSFGGDAMCATLYAGGCEG